MHHLTLQRQLLQQQQHSRRRQQLLLQRRKLLEDPQKLLSQHPRPSESQCVSEPSPPQSIIPTRTSLFRFPDRW